MFNRQEKTVITNTVQGSSTSSSTVKRTFTSSTTFHSQTSSFIQTTTESKILEINSRQQNIPQPTNNVIPYRKAAEVVATSKSEIVQSSPDINIKQFQLDCLNAHNEYRRKHGVGPLKLDSNLSNFAQNWANTIAQKRQLQHSSERKYGENIYWASGKNVNGKVPVDSWYDEIKHYNYKNSSFSSGTGHFTQVVWKNSSDLGVGMTCVGNEVYVVASYYPPGNFSGEFSKMYFHLNNVIIQKATAHIT